MPSKIKNIVYNVILEVEKSTGIINYDKSYNMKLYKKNYELIGDLLKDINLINRKGKIKMNDLKLVEPNVNDKKSALLMLEEIKVADAGLPWQYSGLANLEEATSYEEWVKEKDDESKGINLKDGYVACTTLLLKRESDGKICGSISIRHELNDFLFQIGGHIGYSITPSERGKGYGKLQLKIALEIAKKLGIEKCLITTDEKNIVSNKTIISEGGILENTVMGNDEPLNRYWINLK